MQSTRSRALLIGAGVSALIGMGSLAQAQQSTDSAAPKTQKSRAVKKPAKTDASKEMANQIQLLRDQVEALQRRLDTQSAAEQQTKATADGAAAQAAAAKAQAATATAATQAIPVEVKTAVDAAKPKTDKIYYKGVNITLGGFVEAASVYRERNTNQDITTSFNAIPFNNSAVGQTSQLVFTPRQSRVSALVSGDPDAATRLGFYTELDFQGAAQTANSKETNSYNPRLRHLFGFIDWDDLGLQFWAGQTWSLATLNQQGITAFHEVTPPTIDGQYMPGFVWARQPQVRLTKDFDKQVWLSLSLENPQTTSFASPNALPASVHQTYQVLGTGTGFNTANNYSINHIPDVIGKIAFEPVVADRNIHVEAFGLYSQYTERLNYSNQNATGGGFGAGLIVPILPKVLEFQVSGLGGKGIGRYGSAQLSEVTFDGGGNIHPIHEVIGLAGLTYHVTPRFDTYLFAGEEKESAEAYNLVSPTGVVTAYGYGNPLYSNTGCVSEVATGTCVGNPRLIEQATTGFWLKPYIGSYGMIRWGMQFSHTELQAFAGKGGAPTAIENIFYASFRYYPFTN